MYNYCVIVIYTSPGCASCRKVKNYLKNNNLPFKEKNIFNTLLNDKEIKYLISRTDNGTDDIISLRSKIIQKQKIDFNKMKLSETINFILNNPTVLRRPIIVNDQEMQVGYNAYDITSFIPRARELALANCNNKSCPTYQTCENKPINNDIIEL